VIIAGVFGYKYYIEFKTPYVPGIQAISQNSVIFLEFRNPVKTFRKLTARTDLWRELTDISVFDKINNQILYLDSVVSTHMEVYDMISQNKCFISILQVDTGNLEALYVIELSQSNTSHSIKNFIQDANGKNNLIISKPYRKTEINSVHIPGIKKAFNFSVYKGLFLASYKDNFVKQAIEQIDIGIPVNTDHKFKQIAITAGKNVDANIYFNFFGFSKLASHLANKNNLNFANDIMNFGEWAETDLIIKNDELLLNGYSITSDTIHQVLDCFKQNPQRITITDILPFNVSMILHLGFESFEQYYHSYKETLNRTKKLNDHNKKLNDINKKYNINIEKQFFSWIGNEIACATYDTSGHKKNSTYFLIHANDIKQAGLFLDKITENVSISSGKAFNQQYGDYIIKRIGITGIIPDIFGSLFQNLTNNYYILIKDFVVFADSPETLIDLINNFYMQKTLANNFNYQAFTDNISERSNIYFYCNIRNSMSKISSSVNENMFKEIISNKRTIRNFEGFAIQFSYINQMFYTNIYVKYNPTYEEINPSSWETEVDGTIIRKPQFIKNHKNGKLNVIIFDELSNMYLLDHMGRLKWKTSLIEKPVSPVYQVDYYKNGKLQYLFNTENYLYLIDLNGNYVADYPVKLATTATNSVSVFDYENNKEYRLVLGLADNKIYNYNIKGELVEGWKKIYAKTKVDKPVQHLVNNGKDYLFITDENGNITINNRRGEGRIKLKKSLIRAKHSKFYNNKTNNKGLFVTTDEKGKLVYISQNGKTSKTSFGNFSSEHFFLYEDLDNNSSKDFIYIDKNKLTVFDRFKKIIIKYDFHEEIVIEPVFFQDPNGNSYLGVVQKESKEVCVFDKNGRVFNSQKITGETSFIIGSLNNDRKTNLIVCSGNKVKNYLLE